MGGLQILVHEPALVGLAKGGGDADREEQETPQPHRLEQQPSERFAAWILEHEHGPAVFANELQRPRRPGVVQFVFQGIVMG